MKTLEERRQIAQEYNRYFPGYGFCKHCDRNWKICEPHSTPYQFSFDAEKELPLRDCSPLCRECWQELSIEQRLPYYRQLWVEWQTGDIDQWHLIDQAVQKGF